MPLKKRPLDRDGGVLRDAALIVIASEDTYAVEQYFERFTTRRVQFKVIASEGGRSSPQAVSQRLDEFKREYRMLPDDQFWFCIDRDHWAGPSHIANLAAVLQRCRQADYHVAISNPCFELWLLLHFEDATPAAGCKCGEIETRLSVVAGGYDKTRCGRLPITAEMVHDAIARAKLADVEMDNDIPATPVTRVYRILDVLLSRDAIDLA